MGIFLRKLWQNKPKQWGPWSAVHRALLNNAERMGIDPSTLDLAMPMWNPGKQIDYSLNHYACTNNGVLYSRNSLLFDNDPSEFLRVDSPSSIQSDGFTIIANVYQTAYKTAGTMASVFAFGTYNPVFGSGGNWGSDDLGMYWGGFGGFGIQNPLNQDSSLAFRRTNGVPWAISGWVNGEKGSTLQYDTSAVSTELAIGVSQYLGNADPFNGYIKSLLLFSTALSDDQIGRLSDSPYQLWQPVPQKTYFLPVDAGGTTVTGTLDGKIRIKSVSSVLLDGLLKVKTNAVNLLDGKTIIKTNALNLLDGKTIIKTDALNLLDGKVSAKDSATALLDGKTTIISGGEATNLLDGKAQISDDATNLLDGKAQISDDATNLLDGKVSVKDIATALLDGKLIIETAGEVSDLLDGKVTVKSVTTNLLDGLVIISDNTTDLLDGKLFIQYKTTVNLDGKLTIKDVATGLLDGKVAIKTDAANLLDGKVSIGEAAVGLLDGKAVIKDSSTILLDGKVYIQSDFGTNLLDGKIILTALAHGKVSVTFSIKTPSLSFSIKTPTVTFDME